MNELRSRNRSICCIYRSANNSRLNHKIPDISTKITSRKPINATNRAWKFSAKQNKMELMTRAMIHWREYSGIIHCLQSGQCTVKMCPLISCRSGYFDAGILRNLLLSPQYFPVGREFFCACFEGYSGSDCGAGPLCPRTNMCKNGGTCR